MYPQNAELSVSMVNTHEVWGQAHLPLFDLFLLNRPKPQHFMQKKKGEFHCVPSAGEEREGGHAGAVSGSSGWQGCRNTRDHLAQEV